jgi:O-antigen/teichoic acid export membrane protein
MSATEPAPTNPMSVQSGEPPSPSLKRRVLSAGAWSLGGYGLNLALRLGTNLLMTRLLVPEMFGTMAIAIIVMNGLAMFSDLGLRQSIVQSKRGNDPAFLNTAWLIQIVRGVLLWFVALGISMLVAHANSRGWVPKDSVYADPSLPYVIAILAFGTVIVGFGSTKTAEASRNLALGRLMLIDIFGQIAALVCMFGWIWIDRSIWALVAGSICWSLTLVLLSHIWLPGTANRWQWDPSAFHEIFHFGKWIFISSILAFLAANGDRLLLGSLVDATLLGIYVIAFQIFSAIEQMLAGLIAGVGFPAVSEIARERPAALKAGYYRIHMAVASVAYTCSGILMISGQSVIDLLYDHRYAQAGWMLQVLAAALLTVPFQIAIQCFVALGMPHVLSRVLTLRLVVLAVAMVGGYHLFGVSGALFGLVASHLLCLPMIIFHSVRYGLFDLRRELLFLPMLGVGMVMGWILTFFVGQFTRS